MVSDELHLLRGDGRLPTGSPTVSDSAQGARGDPATGPELGRRRFGRLSALLDRVLTRSAGGSGMIRVCVVAPEHIIGGQAISARTLVSGFAGDPACRVDLQPIDPPLPRWLARTRGVRTIARMPLYLSGLFRTFRNVDVAHIYTAAFWPFALTTTPAILLARLMGKPVLLNYHDGRAAAHLRSRWVRWVLRRATALVFPSRFLRDQFLAVGLDGHVIPNVVDTEAFRFRERTPLRPVLISCRLLEKLYGVENTLRAFARVRERFPDARLIVVGAGDREEEIKALARSENIGGVEFSGEIPHAEVPKWFDQADIWVNSSREDNMPLSIIEAFSSGLPVVTTAAGGIPYIIEHERNGLLVEVDNPAAMASAVLRLLDDEALARRLVAEGRRDCIERYSWAAARQQWTVLFFRLARRQMHLSPLTAIDATDASYGFEGAPAASRPVAPPIPHR